MAISSDRNEDCSSRESISRNRTSGIVFLTLSALGGLSSLSVQARGFTVHQSDGSAASVRALHNVALNGDTIALPAGTFTWSTPVLISKAIKLQGEGSGRIIGSTKSSVTVGTGTKTFTTTKSDLPIKAGQTLRIAKMPGGPRSGQPARDTYMEGTVTSYSGATLVMNITSTGGSGTWTFWWIGTRPQTTIIDNYNNGAGNNNGATPLIRVSEPASGSVEITGLQLVQSSSSNSALIGLNASTWSAPKTLVHDCWFQQSTVMAAIFAGTNHLLAWNCSFDSSVWNPGAAIQLKWNQAPGRSSWSTNSTMGMDDANGATNAYIEDCDFHGVQNAIDADDDSRTVFRHNILDNSALGSHGADTSNVGQRHLEIYDNELIFDQFPRNCTTEIAMQHFSWLRGGTAVYTDNILPPITSQCAGTKGNIVFSVLNTRRKTGAYSCWMTYPAPHQVGQGYGPGAVFHLDHSGSTYGQFNYYTYPEPVYIWNNTGSGGNSVRLNQDPTDACGNNQQVADYIQEGRDYKLEPKPGYVKFTYPHPLRSSSSQSLPTASTRPRATFGSPHKRQFRNNAKLVGKKKKTAKGKLGNARAEGSAEPDE